MKKSHRNSEFDPLLGHDPSIVSTLKGTQNLNDSFSQKINQET